MLSFLQHDNVPDLQQKCCEWFSASKHALMAYARQQLDGEADVELLLTEVTGKVTLAVCSGKVPLEDIAPYTLRALYIGAIGVRRKNMRRHTAEQRYCEEMGIHEELQEDETLGDLEDEHLLARQAAQALPEDLYKIITMRLWYEMSFVEIAKKLGIDETTARRRFDKGIDKIKEQLNKS